MKCYKCGYEFDGGKACPKCGASAIVVNEDYLRRKKEYEESGKVTINQLSFKQSEDGNEDVVADDDSYEPVDFLKNVYDKMKNKSSASKRTKVKKKKPKDGKKKGKSITMSLKNLRKYVPYAAFTLVVLLVIAIFVVIAIADRDFIYAVSKQKVKGVSGAKILVMDKGLYIDTNGKIARITDKNVSALNSNDNFSGIIYETEDGIYYHYGKTSTKIYDGALGDIVSFYISPSGKNAAFVVYEDNTYIIYQVFDGKFQSVSKGATGKEIFLALDNGTLLYKEIEYSEINGVNSMCLTYYNKGVRKTLVEDFIDGVCIKNDKLLILNSQGEIYTYEGKDYSLSSLFMTDVKSIYTETSKNVFTPYGDRIIENKNIIIAAEKTVAINCKNMSTKKLSDDITFEKIIYFEDVFYGIKEGKIVDEKGKAISTIGQCLPAFDQDKKGVVFWDNGKIKLLCKNKIKNICSLHEEPKSLIATKKYYSYNSKDDSLHILKKNGKVKKVFKETYMITR